jgi:hypothetical protein
MDNELLINEGGINYTWFTRIKIEPDYTVTILEHYRKHNSEEFTTEEKNAVYNPYSDIWEEGLGRIAIKYNVPEIGWKIINNPKYIFDYQKEKPPTIKAPKSAEGAKEIIEQVAEEKKSMLDIMSIVEKIADEKFRSTNPDYYQIRDQIYEENLFDKLRNKLEEKKKLTNYPNSRSEDERKIHISIQTIEQSLYDTYRVPLFKIGLAENLNKGFEWLVDEIILTYARFDNYTIKGEDAAKQLFPAKEKYEFSNEAKEFGDFFRTEREDYKIFAIEFIKKMCGK